MFDKRKARAKSTKIVMDKIDNEIEYQNARGATAEDLMALLKMRREVRFNGIDPGDLLKVAANVAIVVAMMSFEMGNILPNTGKKFVTKL